MISVRDFKSVSRGRLKDAQVLQRDGRFDGAFYMSGYAVEIALKARACRTLKWSGFPETTSEFTALQSFKTHNLRSAAQTLWNREQDQVRVPFRLVGSLALES